MKFITRDFCWLLGLGGDGSCEEEMEVQHQASDPTDRIKHQCSSQVKPNNEDSLENEERTRRRAERRRAKRKRQKERKKLEREERMEDASELEEEVTGQVSKSDSEEEERNKNNSGPVPPPQTTEDKSNHKMSQEASEEEPEWDVSSAFVAKVASQIKLKALKCRTQICRENKENEASGSQVENTEEMKRRGEALTAQGIQMFGEGQYRQAMEMFTEAIYCNPTDHRCYGNRSHCYWCLEQYYPALTDAQRSIELAPDWPKGYFRKGQALIGLERHSEAEKAMEQVLKLDSQCKEASSELFNCRVLQLMELGFQEEQSKQLLEKFTNVQAVITSAEARALKHPPLQDQSGSCRSLWVGNITLEVTEKDLWDLFKMFGEIESIKVLQQRFCAFVNFKNANMAARALEKLQGVELGRGKLVMRYPDRWIQRSRPPLQRTMTRISVNAAGTQQSSAASGSRRCIPTDGDKCFYWQTSGFFYGDKCRFKHIQEEQGQDKKL